MILSFSTIKSKDVDQENDPEEFKTLLNGIKNLLDTSDIKDSIENTPLQSININNNFGLGAANLTLETQKYLEKLDAGINSKDFTEFPSSTKSNNNHNKKIIGRFDAPDGKPDQAFNLADNANEIPAKILDIEKIRRLPKLL